MYVEGLVHITELGGEYFRFDEARQELRGERTGIRYAVGTRLRVQVSRVDLDGRKIDFRLVREGEDLPVRATREKPGREAPASPAAGAAVKRAPRPKSRKADAAASESGLSPAKATKASAKKASSGVKGKQRKPRR
jgi:ribonuclease R